MIHDASDCNRRATRCAALQRENRHEFSRSMRAHANASMVNSSIVSRVNHSVTDDGRCLTERFI